MMPGRTNLPVASTTRAPSGALMFCPTAAIFPPRMSTSVPVSVPCEAVSTVAFRMSVSREAEGAAAALAARVCARAATHPSAKMIASVNSLFIIFLRENK